MSAKISYVAARDSLLFNVDGVPVVVPKTHLHYIEIIDALKRGDMDGLRPLLVSPKQSIVDDMDGLLSLEKGDFMFDGAKLNNALTQRIIALKRDGTEVSPLVNFLRNLLENPSKTAVDELYLFMGACDLPITPDGHFIAYKMIRGDWTDKYSGTMDNSVGTVVKMRRNEVDDKRHNTCSDGLHFASLHYVTSGGFGSKSGGDRLVALKINPRDVVSIPSDYNNSKGRACEYTVIRELDWKERLPVNTDGFNMVSQADLEGIGGKDVADELNDAGDALLDSVVVLTPTGVRKWTDAEIGEVKGMLEAGLGLTAIQVKTGMSRRQVARIRDKEVGADIPAVPYSPAD